MWDYSVLLSFAGSEAGEGSKAHSPSARLHHDDDQDHEFLVVVTVEIETIDGERALCGKIIEILVGN